MASESNFKSEPYFQWMIMTDFPPRIHAHFDPTPLSGYSETFKSSSLTVPEGTFLLLICAAYFSITWHPDRTFEKDGFDSNRCRHMTIPKLRSAYMECLTFHSAAVEDEGVYSCYQEAKTDPHLVTTIRLYVAPNRSPIPALSSVGPMIVKKSFNPVHTETNSKLQLTVEYKVESVDESACNATWMLLPDTVLNGRWDNATNKIIASSQNTAYAYLENRRLSPTQCLSQLIILRVCNANSGVYRTHFGNDAENYSVDFLVTVQFVPPARTLDESIDKEQRLFRTRLFSGRVYRIIPLAPQANQNSRLEFFHYDDPNTCDHKKAAFIQLPGANGGSIVRENRLTSETVQCLPPGSLSDPSDSLPTIMFYSIFTLRADKHGKIRWTLNWTETDPTGVKKNLSTATELLYTVVDREDFLDMKTNLLIETDPSMGHMIGDPVTIQCVATACEFRNIILEKGINAIKAAESQGIIRNDFRDAEVKFEKTSIHTMISVTFRASDQFTGGLYSCFVDDKYGPQYLNEHTTVKMEQPVPPVFESENYSQQIYLTPGSHIPLSCSAYGKPLPDIQWSFDDKRLTANMAKLSSDNSTATVSRVGRYKCRVTNRYKQIEREFNVVDAEAERSEERKMYISKITAGAVCGVALILVVFSTTWLIRRWRFASVRHVHSSMLKSSHETVPLESFVPVNDQIEILSYDERYELEKSSFTLCAVLASGEYGKVYKGILRTKNGNQDVAVKVPRENFNLEHHKALISELKIMIYVGQHVNILRILGACTKDIKSAGFYVITEYCDRGCLRDYILKNRDKPCASCTPDSRSVNINRLQQTHYDSGVFTRSQEIFGKGHKCSFFTVDQLLSYAYQSACGMEYLVAKNVIHRDLALRNLLLHGNIVKISDFGLSRHHHRQEYKSRKFDCPLPLFWMALEAILSNKYTEKSDVWSFGVVLWELFSLGDVPYPGKKPDHQLVVWLREGNRMDAPKLAPEKIQKLMISCWNKNPASRPTFSECKRRLGKQLDNHSGTVYKNLLLALASANVDKLKATVSIENENAASSYPYATAENSDESVANTSVTGSSSNSHELNCYNTNFTGTQDWTINKNVDSSYQIPII